MIQLERVEGDKAEAEVVERDELDRFNRLLEYEEAWYDEHEIAPTMAGENLRLSYLLYKDKLAE